MRGMSYKYFLENEATCDGIFIAFQNKCKRMNEPPFEYADHTADIMIIARGRSLGEAFKNAALGVLNLMYDPTKQCQFYQFQSN